MNLYLKKRKKKNTVILPFVIRDYLVKLFKSWQHWQNNKLILNTENSLQYTYFGQGLRGHKLLKCVFFFQFLVLFYDFFQFFIFFAVQQRLEGITSVAP